MEFPKLLTLPQLAEIVDAEYRTLHSWLERGLLRPSVQASRGNGIPNLFSAQDAVRVKIIADLRQSGTSFERLHEAAAKLDDCPKALTTGVSVLVNGSVSIVEEDQAGEAIKDELLTLVYNTKIAIRKVQAILDGTPAPTAEVPPLSVFSDQSSESP
jgi:DNA-binding transcriptional MerR regulator